MGRIREFDEDKVLDAAMQIFWEKGYEATSLSDLTSRMEIQRPSIYSTFGGKKELFEVALRKYMMSRASMIRTKLQSDSSVREALRTFLKVWSMRSMRKIPEKDAFASTQWLNLHLMMRNLKFLQGNIKCT